MRIILLLAVSVIFIPGCTRSKDRNNGGAIFDKETKLVVLKGSCTDSPKSLPPGENIMVARQDRVQLFLNARGCQTQLSYRARWLSFTDALIDQVHVNKPCADAAKYRSGITQTLKFESFEGFYKVTNSTGTCSWMKTI